MTTITLAYCHENADLLTTLDQKLSRAGIPIEHIQDEVNAPPGQFAARVMAGPHPVLLVVTDNFLKSAACMTSALSMLQTLVRQQSVTIVIADGRQPDGSPAPTHFERLADIIRYLNHWQSAFLDITNREQHAPSPAEHTALEAEVGVIHDISVEVGEFIGAIRDAGFVRWEDLERNDFALFFQKFNLADRHEPNREPTEQVAQPEHMVDPPSVIQAPYVQGPLAPVFDAPPVYPSEKLSSFTAESELPATTETDFDIEKGAAENDSPAQEPETEPALPHLDALWPENQDVAPAEEDRPVEHPPVVEKNYEDLAAAYAASPEADVELTKTIEDAWFWLERGHTDRGLQVFQVALEQYPDDEKLRAEYLKALSRHAPESDGASEQLGILHDQGLPEAKSYDLMGEIAFGKGDYDFAKYCWERSATLDHLYPGIWEKLGRLSDENLGEPEAAAHYFTLVLELDPGRLELRERLAQLLLDTLNRPAEAIPHLRQVLAEQPHHPSAWFDLARACRLTGDEQQAEIYYRKATGIKPSLKTDENDQTFLRQPEPLQMPATLLQENEISEEVELEEEILATEHATDEEETDAEVAMVFEDDATAPATEPSTDESLDLDPEETAGEEVHFLENPAAVESPGLGMESEAAEQLPEEDTKTDLPVIGQKPAGKNILTILITGATSGIGRATAEVFAREGHRLILTGRRDERLEEAKQHFEQTYQNEVLTLGFDVRNPIAAEHALNHLPEAWQEVDILINNAGLAKGFAPIQEGSLLHWDTMIDTNLKGLLYVTRLIAPGMVARRRGHIINIGSAAGKEVYANGNVYCATKFAVDALTRAMRLDLVKYNIRVSQVSPGHVEETEFALTRFDGDAERARIYDDFQPLKASDVAETIYFIATRPAHVNVQDVYLFATQQANATVIERTGK